MQEFNICFVGMRLICLPQVGYPPGHSRDASDDVAVGDHDTLWYARGSAGVHNDGNV